VGLWGNRGGRGGQTTKKSEDISEVF